jgi:hypothetical protein
MLNYLPINHYAILMPKKIQLKCVDILIVFKILLFIDKLFVVLLQHTVHFHIQRLSNNIKSH